MSLICLCTAVYHSVKRSGGDISLGWFAGAVMMAYFDAALINFIWGAA